MSELHSIHYCSCIADNPDLQKEVFSTAKDINTTLSKETHDFAATHGISPFDFRTVLIIDENGNHTVIEWCSNRSDHVTGLMASYRDLAEKQLKRYDDAVAQAHDKHLKQKAEQAGAGQPMTRPESE